MKTSKNIFDDKQNSDSRNTFRNTVVGGLATLAFLAYAPNALALSALALSPAQAGQKQKKQEIVQLKNVMPGLQFRVYDSDGKTLEDWTRLVEKPILYPPFVVPYDGSFELQYQDGTIISDRIELDLLIRNLEGEYLINSSPLPHRGPRAFPTRVNTANVGMKPDTFYVVYASKEKSGSLDIKEVRLPLSKEIYASAMALLYVQGQCPPPEIRVVEKEVLREVPSAPVVIQMPTEPEKVIEPVKIEDSCKGGSLLMINPFYTGQGKWGGDFVINARLAKNLGVGAGFFFQPNTNDVITTNIEHDQYTVRGIQIIGETDLITKVSNEMYGVMGNLLVGDPCKLNIGIEGALGSIKHHLNHSLEQTVKDANTGELLKPKYECKWTSDDINQIVYRVGGMLVMPLSRDKFYIFGGGGIIGGLPETLEVKNNKGSIDTKISLGPATDWYAKLGFAIKL